MVTSIELERESTATVLGQVAGERLAQLEKWGEQSHPGMTDRYPGELEERAAYFGTFADGIKEWNDLDHATGDLDWTGILLEEVYEALAEVPNVTKLRAELIQVAAVAVAWIEDLDQQRVDGPHQAFLAEMPGSTAYYRAECQTCGYASQYTVKVRAEKFRDNHLDKFTTEEAA